MTPAPTNLAEQSRRADYRSRNLPDQLDRARRRYAGLLAEAIKGRLFELLTPAEIAALDGARQCDNVQASTTAKGMQNGNASGAPGRAGN